MGLPGALVCSLGTCGWGEEQGGHPTRGVSRNTGVPGGWKAVGLDSREVPERGDAADMRAWVMGQGGVWLCTLPVPQGGPQHLAPVLHPWFAQGDPCCLPRTFTCPHQPDY